MILAIMSDTDLTYVGVILLLYGTFSAGYASGKGDEWNDSPWWIQLGWFALIVGFVITLAAISDTNCDTIDCVPEDPR